MVRVLLLLVRVRVVGKGLMPVAIGGSLLLIPLLLLMMNMLLMMVLVLVLRLMLLLQLMLLLLQLLLREWERLVRQGGTRRKLWDGAAQLSWRKIWLLGWVQGR